MSFGQKWAPAQGRTRGWMKRTIHAAVLVAVAASVPAAWAAGGAASIRVNNVAAGHAVISQAGNVTTIRTSSQNTIINYQRFDVGAGQAVNFAQPNASSRVLNRIQGDGPSSINGTITSNGVVYLVNPAGIMFGPGAVVNVGQFFAAGARMSNQDFLSGANHFTDAAGRVQNAGLIRANQVHLAGLQVGNTGMIVTDGAAGIVTMTAGKDIMIGEVSNAAASPLIVVKMTAPGSSAAGGPAVSNSGTINAGKGQVLLGAGDVYGIAIANSGMLKGRTITLQGGQGITESTGTIDASSRTGKGGSVKVLGDEVGVSGGIDASGATGGGDVRIGGGFHGGEGLESATKTVVTSSATINADATVAGNGGTVVVWSKLGTVYAGAISAVGAGPGNAGGRVEVSGGTLALTGSVNLAAAGTTTGSLLLDPTTLNIDTSGANDATFTGNINFADVPATMNVSAGKLITLLETSSLTLQATSLIHVKTTIDASGDAAAAGNGLTLQVGLAGVGGTIELDSGVSIKLNGAPLTLTVGTGGGITVGGGTSVLSAGTGAPAVVMLNGPITDTGTTNLQITGDTIVQNGAITLGGTLGMTSTTTSSALALNDNVTASAVTLTSNNTVTNTARIDTSGSNGNVTITGSGVDLGAGTITAGTGTVGLYNVAPTSAILLAMARSGFAITPTDLATISAAGINIGHAGTQSGAITATKFAGSAVTTPVTLNSTGGVVLDDGGAATALALGGPLTINAGTAAITAASATNTFAELSIGGTVTLNAGNIGSSTNRVQFAANQTGVGITSTGDVYLNGLGTLTFSSISTPGHTINVTTSGTGDIKATGTLTSLTTNLNAAGAIGATAQRLNFAAGQSGVTLSAGGDIDINGIGNVSFVTVTSTSGAIDIKTAAASSGNINATGTLTAHTTATLDADGAIGTAGAPMTFAAGQTGVTLTSGAGTFVKGLGDLTLTSANATGALSVVTAASSGGNIEATGTLAGTTITLNADGGIGTAGPVTLNPSSTVSLTTAGTGTAGNIDVTTGAAALNTPTIHIDSGGGQTVTLGGGAVTLGNTNLSGADLVVNATSFTITGGDTVTANTAKIALTGGASIAGTLNLEGEFDSTGTTFTVDGEINTDSSGDINILHTGAVSLNGTLAANMATVRIAGTTVTQNSGGAITADRLGVRATGSGAAIDLSGTNTITDFDAAASAAGASINLQAADGVSTNAVTALAASSPFPAFAAITGISTSNGDVTIHAGNSIEINNVLNAGTGTVSLFCPDTFGDVNIDSTLTGGIVQFGAANDVNIRAAVNAHNSGSGGFSSTGAALDISSAGSLSTDGTATLIHTGGVTFEGNASAITLNIQGQTVTQTTGTLTATNLGVKATGTGVGIGDITLPGVTLNASGQVAAATASGKTISITTSGPASVGSASSTTALSNTGGTVTFAALTGLDSGTGTSSLTATTGNITGPQTITGTTVDLTATAGGIGSSASPVGVSGSTLNLTTGGSGATGNIYINAGAAALNTNALAITMSGTGHVVSITAGAFTVGGDLDLTGDNVQLGVSSFTLNSGKTLTAANLAVDSSGAVALAGTLTVSGGEIAISATDIIQSGGAITADSLGTLTSSKNGSNQAVQLTAGTNNIGNFSADANASGGTVALTTAGATSSNSTGSMGGTGGVGSIAGVSGVTTTNGDITIKANGALTVGAVVNAGTGTATLVTLPASGGTLTVNAALTGADVALASDGIVTIASSVTAQNAGAGVFTSTGSGNFNLNSGGSITADDATIIHTGTINIGASISAATLDMQGGTISQTAGLVTATTLGLRSTTGGVTLNHVTFNSGGTLAAVAVANQNVTITSTNGIEIGSAASSLAPNNAGTNSSFAPISGVTTSGALGTPTTSLTATTGNITSDGTDPVGGTNVNLTATAGGIGASGTDVILNSTGTATLTTGAASAAGNVYVTTSAASLGGLTFTTDAGSVQTITIDKTGAFALDGNVSTVNDNLVVTATGALSLGNSVGISTGTGTLTLQAGTSGTGNLSFGTSDTVTAPTVLLQAGSQNGTDTAARVDITNVPTLSGTTSLTVRQDASFTDAGINGSALTNYTLQSDGGNVTVATGGNVAGTHLTLTPKTGGTVTINGAIAPDSLVSNGATTNLGGNVTSAGGDQTYNGNVVLTQNETLSGATLTFTGTITSQASQAFTLSLAGTTGIEFDGNIGGTAGGTAQLGSLTITSSAAVQFGTSGAFSVVTTGGQSYTPAVTLAADTVLDNITSGDITFSSTINGAHNLEVNSAGNEVFDGHIGGTAALTSLTTDSAASGISGGHVTFASASTGSADPSVKTTGAQLYRDAAALGVNTTLSSTGSGDVTFVGAVDGAAALIVNTAGITTFTTTVGGATPLTSVTTDAAGSVKIGGNVSTTGAQAFSDPLTLTADAILASSGSGNITLGGTVDGGHNLTVNTAGTTAFDDAVGATTALTSVTTDAAGTTTLGGASIKTTGAQTFNDPVTVAADVALTSTGSGNVTFATTVDGNHALTVNTAGTTFFDGQVGATTPLDSLTTDAAGATTIATNLVIANNDITFNDPVTLTTGLSINTVSSGDITFASTVNGAQALAVNTGGVTTFGGIVGGVTPLSSVITDLGGSTAINTTAITTTGVQNYNDDVTLGAGATLTSNTSGDITFHGLLDGAHALTIDTAGITTFGGTVGGVTALTSIVTDAAGSTAMNGGDITTTGLQTYHDVVTLGATTVISSGAVGDITFGSTVNGAHPLVVNTAGTTTFRAAVGNTTPLASVTTDAPGTTDLNGGTLNTTGTITFNDNVILSADMIVTSTGVGAAGNVSFEGTVNGAFALTVNSSGQTLFNGVVGGTTNLTTLTTDAPGTTVFNNAPATTTDDQVFNDDVILTTDTVLTTSPTGFVHFYKTVNGTTPGGQSLTIFSATDTIFDGAVGNTVPLHNLSVNHFGGLGGTIQLNGGTVATTGFQNYGYATVLGANTTLTSTGTGVAGNITFGSTLDGAFSLETSTGGTNIFTGFVGGITPLTSLTTDAPGSVIISGGGVTTTGAQGYNGNINLGVMDVTLTSNTGGNISLNGSVDGPEALTIDTAGVTTLGGLIGGTTPLTSLTTDAAGSTTISGGGATTTGLQTYNDPVTLTTTAATLASTGSGNITFASTVDGGQALTVNTAGVTTFDGAVGNVLPLASVTTDAAGSTDINGGVVATFGAQAFNDDVLLTANTITTSLSSGDITFGKTINGAFTLTVNTGGTTSFLGAVGNITPLASVTTDAPGATDINGGTINTTGIQFYGDDVILSADATLTSTGAGALGDITFEKTLNGAFAITVNTAGVTTFNGVVGGVTNLTNITTDAPGSTVFNNAPATTTGDQDFLDDVVFSTDTTLTTSPTGFVHFHKTVNGLTPGGQSLTIYSATNTIFDGAVGNLVPLNNLTVNHFGALGGTIQINGGVVNTAGTQAYNYAVVLGGDTTLTSTGPGSAGNISFASTLDGAHNLTVNTAGVTSFLGAVGATTPLTSLTTDAPGSTDINGASVNTTGLQLYADDVTLSADTTLDSSASGNITFGKTVNGGYALTVNTSGVTTFTGAVGATTALTSVTTDAGGSTAINGGIVTTTGLQLYSDPVTLGADTVITSTGSGDVTFASTVNGAQALTVNTAGVTTFGGFAGGITALTSLTTDAPGSTTLSGGGVTTDTFQTFNDPVTLSSLDATLTSNSGGNITLARTVNGAQALTVNTAGVTTFGGFVGATTPLTSLTTDAAGSTVISGGGVTTTTFQTFNDAVTLSTLDAVLTSTGSGNITFASTVDGGQALTVNTAGTTIFDGAVGGATPLTSVTTDAPGITDINGGEVITTGLQLFNDDVVLTANTTVTSTGSGAITFGKTINGAYALNVDTSGLSTFLGSIGNTTPLASLTTDAPGTTDLNGGTINTTGIQFYGDDVILSANATLTSTGVGANGDITFNKTLNGAFSITVNTAGTTTFNGVVGGVTNLTNITTDAPGTTVFNNAPATTTDDQDFFDDVIFSSDTTLTTSPTGYIHFYKTVNGLTPGGQSLTIYSATNTIFDGVVGGNVPLHNLIVNHFGALSGTIQINGGAITTTGVQNYNYAVVLGANAVLTSTGSGSAANISFASTIDGAHSLTVNTAGVTSFLGAVGTATPLTSLTTDAAGSTDINGAAVHTTGLQLFADDVILSANTTLTSSGAGNITFGKTVNGGYTLAVNTSGVTTFSGTVGATTALTSVTTNAGGSTAINGGVVDTTGLQLYNDAVNLGADTVITSTASAAVTFVTTVNGAHTLSVNTGGVTTFGGFVGGSTPLTSLTTNAAGSTVISGGGATTTGLQLFGDPVTLSTAAVTLKSIGAGNITFAGTVNGAKALTVDTAGVTKFGGAVGGITALTSVTTDAAGSTMINGGIVNTSAFQDYNDAVNLSLNPVTLTSTGAGNITFASTLNGAEALAVDTSGITTFGGIVGGTTALTSLTTNAGGATAINGGAVTTSTFQTYGDAVGLGANTTLGGTVITFGSSADSSGSARDLTINNTSNVSFAGATGSSLTLGAVNVTGSAGTTTIDGLTTVGSLTIANNAVINGTVTSAGAVAVTGQSAITGTVTSTNSTILLTGAAVVHGALHASSNITAGSTFTLTGTTASSTGDITVHGAASINGNVLASAGNITIDGPTNLTGALTAGQNVHAPSAVTLGGSAVVTAHGAGGITLGNITGGPASSLKLVTTDATDTTIVSGPIIRVGSIGSAGARIGNLEFDSVFVTRLGGDIYANLVTFGGSDGGALATVPTIATISHDTGDLTIDTNGFTMAQNQKLSVFNKNQLPTDHTIQGSLMILSHGGTIQIGDLSASGNITVNAGTVLNKIVIIARNGGSYLKPDGSTGTDHGLDIVSGAAGTGSLNFTGTLSILVPAGVNPSSLVQFAAPTGQENLKSSPTLRFDNAATGGVKLLTQDQTITINAASFEGPSFTTTGTVLDLTAVGVGNPVSSLGAVIAQNLQVLAPERDQAISGALKDALQELGIFARDLRTDELVDFLIGRALYDDVPYKLNPSPQDNQVSSNRLPYSPVVPTVDAYRALFLKAEVDKTGKPVLDANGKQKMQAQDTLIKNAFGMAWQVYSKDKKTDATPAGFRAYLEANEAGNAKCASALGYLNKLRDLLNQIKSLGLTDTEFDVSKKVILAKVRPANIKDGDFLAVVMGPSTRMIASR